MFPLFGVELDYLGHRVVVRTVRAALLKTTPAQISAALATVVLQLQLVLGTQPQRVDFVQALQLVAAHHTTPVVLLGAFLAQLKFLMATVDLRPSVLATHAGELAFSKLLIVGEGEANFILHEVAGTVIEHKVILKRIAFSLEEHCVCSLACLPHSADSAQLHFAEEESEHLTRFHQPVDVDVPTVEDHLLRPQAVAFCPVQVVSIQVSHMQDGFSGKVLGLRRWGQRDQG